MTLADGSTPGSTSGSTRPPGSRLAAVATAAWALVVTSPRAAMRGRTRALWVGLRLAALGALVYGIAAGSPGVGLHGLPLVVLVLVIVAAGAWLGWLAAVLAGAGPAVHTAALATLVISGALLAGMGASGYALGLCGAGVFMAVLGLPAARAVGLCLAGVAAIFGSGLAGGQPAGRLGAYTVILTGIMLGAFNRRQYFARLEQAESLITQTRRTQAEQARAAALSERARLAREIHDVLAHSLGALAVQLEAADALLAAGRDPERAHRHVIRARGLAVGGLAETRRAIGALRGEALPLTGQLAALSRDHQAGTGTATALRVSGTPRRLPPDAELTAFRTAQEAPSNARKHAPDAPVSIDLEYQPDALLLAITDRGPADGAAAPAELAGSGGGYGLAGLAERAALIGGVLTAGAEDAGWAVRLRLPA